MKNGWMGKMLRAALVFTCAAALVGLCGCSASKDDGTGGYSISVNELYLTENSIVIDTELKGPEKGENPGADKSYPYIVVRTEYLENPVVFQ